MRRFVLFSVLVLCGLLLAGAAFGQVVTRRVVTDFPYLRYEGVLTDPLGARMAGHYGMTFRIYDVPEGGSPLWTEEKEVEVKGGLFTVTLGREVAIPAGLLAGEGQRYVELEVEGEVLSPRSEIVVAGSSFAATSSGGVLRGGPGAVPYGGVPTGPAGGDLTGNYPDPLIAPDAVASAEIADGAIVNADVSAAAAIDPTKISGTAWTSANDGPGSGLNADLLDGVSSESFLTTSSDYGRSGVAANLYEGASTLTSKYVDEAGPDEMTGSSLGSILQVTNTDGGTGIISECTGDVPLWSIGLYGEGENTSTGAAIGSWCKAMPAGTGPHYGLYSEADGNSIDGVYGVYGLASNANPSGFGVTYGGYFLADSTAGTGTRYGLMAEAYGNDQQVGQVFGSYSRAINTSDLLTQGIHGFAENTGNGTAIGGDFFASSLGTGPHTGVEASSGGNSFSSVTGVYAEVFPSGTGDSYAGYFRTASASPDGGTHYGTYATGFSISGNPAYGTYSEAHSSESGAAYGGYFTTVSEGTGTHYALYADGQGESSASVYGVRTYADNTSTGYAYGGRFSAGISGGTGTHYGVYGYEAAGGSGAAVYASGDFTASGTKNAVVKTSRGHSLLSVVESPEVWFEDLGEGRLVNGQAHIELDALFLETVAIDSEHPMRVFVQLTSGDPMDVVVRKGTMDFDVIAEDPASTATFDYRVMAKRRGYEDDRFRRTDVGYDDPNLYPELLADMDKERGEEMQRHELEREKHARERERMRVERERMEEEQEAHRQGRLQYRVEQGRLEETHGVEGVGVN